VYAHLYNIKQISFPSTEKTKLFKLLLTNKVQSNIQGLRNITANRHLWLEYDRIALRKYLEEATVSMVEQTNRGFLRELNNNYGNIGALLYQYIMEGSLSNVEKKGFNYWRDIRLQTLCNRLDIIFEQDIIYNDNYKIMIAYFSEIEQGTIYAVEQTIQIFKYFNGGLDDILTRLKHNVETDIALDNLIKGNS